QPADRQVTSDVKLWEQRPRITGSYPDGAVRLAGVEAVGAGVQLRRAGTFAVPASVEGPAVIRALKSIAKNGAPAQPHAAWGAGALQRGRRPGPRPKKPHRAPRQIHTDGRAPQPLTLQPRVPVVDHCHGYAAFFGTAGASQPPGGASRSDSTGPQ